MRHAIRQMLFAVIGFPPIRWLIIGFDAGARRLLWLWSHIRLAALIRNQGAGCVCHWNVDLKNPQNITLGNNVVIGTNVVLGAASPIILGDNVRISRDVMIETAGLNFQDNAPPYPHISEPIEIARGAWIGARAIILGGVHIGENAVIASGALVNKDVPANAIVAGVPARIVGKGKP
jgi:maltose O-acetyltransferase